MAAKQNTGTQKGTSTTDDIPLPSLEESLLSMEKLDRASPELWPEQNGNKSEEASRCSTDSFTVPGVSEFATQTSNRDQLPWNKELDREDLVFIEHLSSLSKSGLIMEVKKLHDLAYQLGLEEAKEMTRGKYLNIFKSRRPR